MDSQQDNKTQQPATSRRKFLTTAAKVAPVITTMAAMPVWATSQSSGHQSGASMNQVVQSNGYSPGYYTRKFKDKNNRLPLEEYKRPYGKGAVTRQAKNRSLNTMSVSSMSATSNKERDLESESSLPGVFTDSFIGHPVEVVLDPSLWPSDGSITQVERFALTAFYNADPTVGPADFPYNQEQVIDFYHAYIRNEISHNDALTILTNLVHCGAGDMPSGMSCN